MKTSEQICSHPAVRERLRLLDETAVELHFAVLDLNAFVAMMARGTSADVVLDQIFAPDNVLFASRPLEAGDYPISFEQVEVPGYPTLLVARVHGPADA